MKEMFVSGGGTNENSAFMTAYIMEKSKPMIRQLDQLNAQYTNQAAMLTNATENARTQFEANQANKATKLSVYQMLLDRIGTKKANDAATLQQQFDNQIKLATLNKPVVVGSKSRLVDPTTGKVIS
jgi:inorganic triphosphatase YgiF